jgi:hypothetical protein
MFPKPFSHIKAKAFLDAQPCAAKLSLYSLDAHDHFGRRSLAT